MKNKIVWKLSAYFTASLVVFTLIISGIFIAYFRSSTIELKKTELQERAAKISETLSALQESSAGKMQGGGYGAYIKFLNDIAMADVWIVDQDLNIITYGMGQHAITNTSELPENAKQIVEEVFLGNTEFSESFSDLLNSPSLTVGTPIKSADGSIIGVVLLHSSVSGINVAITNGIQILGLSILIALLITLSVSALLSYRFTKPLNRINYAAIKLAEGDYTAKAEVQQKDEIGTLSNNIDILAQRLFEASKESEKLEKLRREFIANISHELRTPISVVRASLEALVDGVVTDEKQTKEFYAQMLSESKHLQRLVNDLLDLSRLQNTDFQLEMTNVNLCDIVSDVARSVRNLAKEKSVEMSFNNQACDFIVYGDYDRLRQMILIILDNAVKFSKLNGHIFIDLSQKENLTLSIRDEGQGISPKDLPYIFDRFYKTKAESNELGTGLGLAIAKQIAERHNIDLQAFSTLGVGSEFLFTFKNTIAKEKR